jgi:hypothetical protein
MADLEHETIRDRLHALRNGRHHHVASHVGGNGGGGLFKDIERRVRGLETWQLLLLGAGGVLLVDHLIAPKGMSFASKAMDKLGGAKPALPPPPPPPPVLAPVAKGDWTGANAQAGWNRGMSPYGGWALNAPAGPWPYAHPGQTYGWQSEYPWAQ